jgi:nucleoside 2-deoxyribosyltransferase
MKIYLAGAIAKMGAEQKTSLGTIAQILRNKGLEVFNPIEHKIENGYEMDNKEWARKVFEMDKAHLDEADVVVLCYNGVESVGQNGTCWECGYSYAKQKPVIIVTMNPASVSSLMLAFGSHSCVKGVRGLRRYDFKKLRQNSFTTILG